MLEKTLDRETAKKIMAIPGEARGIHLKNDAEYILSHYNKKTLEKVEKELESLGYPLKYKKVNNLGFYPAGLRVLSLLVIQKTLNLNEEQIKELCAFATRASFAIRLYLKFFYSIPKILEKASQLWRDYWTFGKLEVKEHNEIKGEVKIEIKDFSLHPLYCRCLEGYFAGLAKMITKNKNITCKEISCEFNNGKNHLFLIKYK